MTLSDKRIQPISTKSLEMVNDFFLEVLKGNIKGHSVVHKFGTNTDIDVGTEDIWTFGGPLNYLASASVVNITSLDVNDTLLGTGMRTMTIEGLDANFDQISEIIELDGQNIVTTVNEYTRIPRMYGLTAGSNGVNIGGIHCFTGTATLGLPDDTTKVYAHISPAQGQTLIAAYTIPRGKEGYLFFGFTTTDSSLKPSAVKMFSRSADQANPCWRISVDLKIGTSFRRPYVIPLKILEKTDIRVQATADANNTYASAGFDLLLVDIGE